MDLHSWRPTVSMQLIKTINTTSFIHYLMKFNLFGKKSKCLKCGKKFKNETELMEHNRTAHAT